MAAASERLLGVTTVLSIDFTPSQVMVPAASLMDSDGDSRARRRDVVAVRVADHP